MAKPTTVPRWGKTLAGVLGPNDVAPSSGKQDVGYAIGEKPSSGNMNWFLRLVYEWLAWVNSDAESISGAQAKADAAAVLAPRAWAKFHLNAGSPPVVAIGAQRGIASAVVETGYDLENNPISTTTMHVTLSAPMPSVNYAVIVTPAAPRWINEEVPPPILAAKVIDTTHFDLYRCSSAGLAASVWAANDEVNLVVMAA